MGIICKIIGHKWRHEEFKRFCTRRGCDGEEWVVERLHPKIGEAKYYWRDVTFPRIFEGTSRFMRIAKKSAFGLSLSPQLM